MRILITNTGPWGTGSGTVANGLMQELKRRNNQVMAIFPDLGLRGPEYNKYYDHPEQYRILPFPVNFNNTFLYTFPLIIPDPNPRNYSDAWTFKDMSQTELRAYFGYIKKELVRIIKEFSPDVIECQHIWAFDYLLGTLGYNYISVAHHSDQLGFLNDRRMRPYARNAAQKASFIMAISDYVREEVIDLYRPDPEKVITVTNGYHQSIYYPFSIDKKDVLSKYGIIHRKDLPVITFAGKISRRKGIDVLLEANHIIQKKRKALLLLLGSGTLDRFSKEEKKKFCLENTFFLGHRSPEELAILHNTARLSVLPSRSEGFGIAALEAMGCGLPVVATDVGGLPSFVVGELVIPDDPAALAEAIVKLLQLSEDNYKKLSELACETAKQYSWASLVDKRFPYYQEVAAQNRKISSYKPMNKKQSS